MKWQSVVVYVVLVAAVVALGLAKVIDSHVIVALLGTQIGMGGVLATSRTSATGLTVPPPAGVSLTSVPPKS